MKLTQKESAVIRLRYGLDIDDPMTYQEIAEIVGLGRTMVKQLEQRALKKLKHPDNREAMMEIQGTIDLISNPNT